jgi:HEAT repeat protein
MSENPRSNQPLSAGDALPPVEPPSAGFILQLFVVPGIIVSIIVMVWLVFNWVARTGNDPDEFIRALRRNNANRWQAAFGLAGAIKAGDAQGQALRQDAHLADELAKILDEEIKTSSTKEEEPIALRAYLCQALGQFEIANGLPMLLKAASTQRSEQEIEVRLAALRAIALLDENMKATSDAAFHTPEVTEKLLAASRDPDSRVRSVAAYALGVIGGQPFEERLEALLADGNPDVRYNAATWLAPLGDAKAVPVLAEMLDPDELAGINLEKTAALREDKRLAIVSNALRATGLLAGKNPAADLGPLAVEIKKLLDSSIDERLKAEARDVLKQIQSDRPAAKAPD